MWLTGPPFRTLTKTFAEPLSCFPLVDCEIRPEFTCSKVQVNDVKFVNPKMGSERFLRFSTWESLVRGDIGDIDSSDAYERTELFVIQTTQGEAYCRHFLTNMVYSAWEVDLTKMDKEMTTFTL